MIRQRTYLRVHGQRAEPAGYGARTVICCG